MMEKVERNKGITLVALVVTVVVLLILSGVSINLVLGNNGIIKKAGEAAQKTKNAELESDALFAEIEKQITKQAKDFDKVNKPKLSTGMTPIYFELNGTKYETKTTTEDSADWYNYEEKKWANAQTEDGSMWVWIPRFAYKVNESTKTMDIVFLIDATDYYKDEKGNVKKAVRETTNYVPDTKTEYTVHPAFTDESSIGYKNGGWSKEITGIWVSKFEAGAAGENNTAATKTAISGYNYPVFMGTVPSYNNIKVGNIYLLSKQISIGSDNIYGLTSEVDSHLIKNSEWGAAAYLGQSKYGLDTEYVWINNVSLNGASQDVNKNGTTTAISGRYAVTGCSGRSHSAGQNRYASDTAATPNPTITLGNINNGTAQNVRVWDEKVILEDNTEGTRGSNTGTVYGIYDMSGGLAEYTGGYIKMENNSTLLDNLKTYGSTFVFANSEQTKFVGNTPYVMEYPEYTSGGLQTALSRVGRYGDGYLETWGWYGDWNNNNASGPFCTRGAYWVSASGAGLFAFYNDEGYGSNERFSRCVGCAVAL